MSPYLFRVRATPRRLHPQAHDQTGAYVRAWVISADVDAARGRVLLF